jgi:hypothetical protein
MTPRQLRLFPEPKPLLEHLGSAFFHAVPRDPGVYRFLDANGKLLYVGKARDLRARLNAYRSVARVSRRVRRLVSRIHSVTWEVCSSETAALLRENDLLRTLRPPFNRLGVWPTGWQVALAAECDGLTVTLARQSPATTGRAASSRPQPELLPSADHLHVVTLDDSADPTPARVTLTEANTDAAPQVLVYGAFRRLAVEATLRIAQCLWQITRQRAGFLALPPCLSLGHGGRLGGFRLGPLQASGWAADLQNFFAGTEDTLSPRLAAQLPAGTSGIELALREEALQTIQQFFLRGPAFHLAASRRLGKPTAQLLPEERDDQWLLQLETGVPRQPLA